MSRLYVGNLDPRIGKEDLADVFEKYGATRDIWVARKPPGFAFVTFEDERDAEDAVRGERNNKDGWRVEISKGGGRGSRSYRDDEPYRRRSRSPPRYRDRSPPRHRRSPSGGKSERRSPSYGR